MAGPPAAEWPGRPRPGPGGRRLMGAMQTRRREMALVLLLGVAGAGLVFLAVRQGWAHVRTAPPPPLPGSDSLVTGQDLVPAVLATRGIARRLVGLALAGLGAGIAAAVSLPVTTADAIAAVSGRAGYRGAAESGAAGSATAGGGHGGGAPLIAGFPAHVAATAFPWRLLALAGGAAVIAAGLLVIWRAAAWPVMSSRFDPPERPRPRQVPLAARPVPDAADAASIWESLSRGEDPTSGGPG